MLILQIWLKSSFKHCWLLVVWQVNHYPLSSFVLNSTIWKFFRMVKIGVMWQIQLNYAPNMQGIHYILAHWINHVVQVLFKLNMVCRLENLFKIVCPTSIKAPKGNWNSTSLPRSWKFMVINSWILSKQGGFIC